MAEKIRPMQRDELDLLINWAAEEGWNPGLHDAELFWNLDPEGFLALDLDQEFCGGGAIIRHNSEFGFMGLFIVEETHRGKQHGRKLWYARRDQLLKRLDENATIGLDGVDAMVGFYKRGGFVPFTRYRRFTISEPLRADVTNPNIVPLAKVDPQLIADLDRQCFPGDRSAFLHDWIKQPQSISLACIRGEELQGFAVMRKCRSGWKIGPLFAEAASSAEQLLVASRQQAQEEPVFLDVPDNNPEAVQLCNSHEMTEVFGCTRMYFGPPPKLAHHKIFGITTLEVG
ncbi:GNAT family N-acetyltransferase [Thalassoglobus sp. JC818]|uniref:GNAT family N-acetyltransferase n=1 Tax=Thalassoglobus sp. JC818 TaxID=3232136 RepID=UPI003459F773